jgi:thiol-disulfide isomerase/thioredoxin
MKTRNTSKLCAVTLIAAFAFAVHLRPAMAEPPIQGVLADNFILLDQPTPVPSVPFLGLGGGEISLAAYSGNLVLLNFWATWCAPCIREMPSLDRLQGELEADGLKVIAVSVDRGGEAVIEPFLADLGLRNLTVLMDPKFEGARAFVVRGLPATFLIDQEGRILGGLEGPAEWDSPEAVKLIRYYLDGKAETGSRRNASKIMVADIGP